MQKRIHRFPITSYTYDIGITQIYTKGLRVIGKHELTNPTTINASMDICSVNLDLLYADKHPLLETVDAEHREELKERLIKNLTMDFINLQSNLANLFFGAN